MLNMRSDNQWYTLYVHVQIYVKCTFIFYVIFILFWYISYQIPEDFYFRTIYISDFYFYQSDISSQYLYQNQNPLMSLKWGNFLVPAAKGQNYYQRQNQLQK